MDKQKQIEEMAKIMLEKAFENYETSGSVEIDTEVRRNFYSAFLVYCEALYNAGYCKIPDGAVVLEKKEYDRLKQVEAEKDRLYEIKLDLENQLIEKGFTEYVGADEIEKATRKETAEKFAEKLKARFHKSREYYEVDTGTAWSNGHIGGLINDTIDEIAKEIMGG